MTSRHRVRRRSADGTQRPRASDRTGTMVLISSGSTCVPRVAASSGSASSSATEGRTRSGDAARCAVKADRRAPWSFGNGPARWQFPSRLVGMLVRSLTGTRNRAYANSDGHELQPVAGRVPGQDAAAGNLDVMAGVLQPRRDGVALGGVGDEQRGAP